MLLYWFLRPWKKLFPQKPYTVKGNYVPYGYTNGIYQGIGYKNLL